jgi:hypothetical protein
MLNGKLIIVVCQWEVEIWELIYEYKRIDTGEHGVVNRGVNSVAIGGDAGDRSKE